MNVGLALPTGPTQLRFINKLDRSGEPIFTTVFQGFPPKSSPPQTKKSAPATGSAPVAGAFDQA
ncbi:hypothetical protein SAMN04488061_2898 [Filomicrobium insigne]|uniref:Uncharacterized protein n=1 Tax=Filomicrobium insigne TaxID=418854 RepID=A0A1H0SHG6_9HYPH|nr:hypothetical protein SAMN04488061_2898 [Filomicrobium insigne]